ncbi:MAG: chromate transporter [Lachnospiraceae bacterium]|nr:chromate transporter [Lachnospiraceae bacterium]
MIFLRLFLSFFKIGLFTFGGGYAMIPLIQEEVLVRGWLDSGTLVDFIAVSESTPGPFAVNIATYVGSQNGGIFGAVCATAGVVLPSFLIILLVATFYERFRKNRIVEGAMTGLKPAVVGLIGKALVTVALTVFVPMGVFTGFTWTFAVSAVLCVIAFVMAMKKIHPIFIIVLCAAAGIAAGYLLDL